MLSILRVGTIMPTNATVIRRSLTIAVAKQNSNCYACSPNNDCLHNGLLTSFQNNYQSFDKHQLYHIFLQLPRCSYSCPNVHMPASLTGGAWLLPSIPICLVSYFTTPLQSKLYLTVFFTTLSCRQPYLTAHFTTLLNSRLYLAVYFTTPSCSHEYLTMYFKTSSHSKLDVLNSKLHLTMYFSILSYSNKLYVCPCILQHFCNASHTRPCTWRRLWYSKLYLTYFTTLACSKLYLIIYFTTLLCGRLYLEVCCTTPSYNKLHITACFTTLLCSQLFFTAY